MAISFEKGDLVMNEGNELGIVISLHWLECELLLGNGKRDLVDIRSLREVLFSPTERILASWPALVDAYVKQRGFE